jgi:hypothetical protein
VRRSYACKDNSTGAIVGGESLSGWQEYGYFATTGSHSTDSLGFRFYQGAYVTVFNDDTMKFCILKAGTIKPGSKPSDSFKRKRSKKLESDSEDSSSGSDSDQPVIIMNKKSKPTKPITDLATKAMNPLTDAATNALIQQLLIRQKQDTQTLEQQKLNLQQQLVTNAKAIESIKTKEEQEKLALLLKFDQQINEKNSEAAAAHNKRKLEKQKAKELHEKLFRQEKDLIVIVRDLKHQQEMQAALKAATTMKEAALQAEIKDYAFEPFKSRSQLQPTKRYLQSDQHGLLHLSALASGTNLCSKEPCIRI